jgi:hypothetical protein
MRARRLIPFGLLGVLLVSSGVGAWLGHDNSARSGSTPKEPSAFAARAVADTLRAGSAEFAYSTVMRGTGPSFFTVGFGTGAVNFSTGESRFTLEQSGTDTEDDNGVNHQVPFHTIVNVRETGGHTYIRAEPLDVLGSSRFWAMAPYSTAPGPLRAMDDDYLAGVLNDFTRAGASSRFSVAGHTMLKGERVTEYQWQPSLLECFGGRESITVTSTGTWSVWLDAHGRLRRIQTSTNQITKQPRHAATQLSMINTLQFTSYGVPVHVVAPKLSDQSRGQVPIIRSPPRTSCQAT